MEEVKEFGVKDPNGSPLKGRKESNIKILSYNIRLYQGLPHQIVVGFKEKPRKRMIIEYLRNSDADVIGLQEVWADKQKVLFIEALKVEYPYSYCHITKFWYQGSGLLILSKFPLFDQRAIYFKDLSETKWYSSKGLLSVQVEVEEGRRLSIINIHPQSGETEKRTNSRLSNFNQIYDLITEVNDFNNPIILLGDYNVMGRTKEYRLMKTNLGELGLRDAYTELYSENSGCTFDCVNNSTAALAPYSLKSLFVKVPSTFQVRFDYYFVNKKVKIVDVVVDKECKANIGGLEIDGSDHYPLIAMLKINC